MKGQSLLTTVAVLLATLLWSCAPAVQAQSTLDIGHKFNQFTACASPPCDSEIFCYGSARSEHSLFLTVGGTVAATTCTMNLQGAPQATGPWGIISSTDDSDTACTANTNIFISNVGAGVRCVKVVIESFSGGTDPTVDNIWIGR